MKAEDILYAMNEVEDEPLRRAGQWLDGKKALRLRPHIGRVLLIAAALAFALGGIGWYVYHSAIAARFPRKGETLTYHEAYYDEHAEYEEEVQISRAGLVIQVDSEAESRVCLFTPPDVGFARTAFMNFASVLETGELPEGVYTSYPPELRVGLEEGLRQAGVSRTEAEDLCFRWYLYQEDREAPTLMVEIYNAYDLYGRDLILGLRDAEVEIVSEPETEGIQRLELRHHQLLESNYLLQFDSERQYLLVICGDSASYDFPALEAFADSLAIQQTKLTVTARETDSRGFKVLATPDGWLPEAWQ